MGNKAAILNTEWVLNDFASGWQTIDLGHRWVFGITTVLEGGSESKIHYHRLVEKGESKTVILSKSN